MKTLLVDSLTDTVLCQTTENRIVPLLKMLIVDVNVITLLPKRHQYWYDTLTTEFIQQNQVRYRYTSQDCVNADTLPEQTILKKSITVEKLFLLEILISCADIKMNNYHTFFHSGMCDLLDEKNKHLLEEYVFVRKLPIEEVRKDLLVRKSIYDTQLVKSQANIDFWVDRIMFETDISTLQKLKQPIIDSFFRP